MRVKIAWPDATLCILYPMCAYYDYNAGMSQLVYRRGFVRVVLSKALM